MQIFSLNPGSELVDAPGSDIVLNAAPERSGGQARGLLGLACGRGSAGRASPCQGEGRGFESRRPLGGAACGGLLIPARRLYGRHEARSYGGVAEWLRQGPAKPCTRVRFPSPPRILDDLPSSSRVVY